MVKDGVLTAIPGYAEVQGIFIGVVAAFVIIITIIGPEYVHLFLRFLIAVVDDHAPLGNMLRALNSTRRRSRKALVVMPRLLMKRKREPIRLRSLKRGL